MSTRYRVYTNGYFQVKHPKTRKLIHEHRLVAEINLGRKLREDEVVHHLDFNRANNKWNNLLVLLESQHIKLHAWLEKGAPIAGIRGLRRKVKDVVQGKILYSKEFTCEYCQNSITRPGKSDLRFCSVPCYRKGSRTKIDKRLLRQLIARSTPWTQIGNALGVSDNGARQIARRFGYL